MAAGRSGCFLLTSGVRVDRLKEETALKTILHAAGMEGKIVRVKEVH